jgi:hypothetical protein
VTVWAGLTAHLQLFTFFKFISGTSSSDSELDELELLIPYCFLLSLALSSSEQFFPDGKKYMAQTN